MNKKNLFKFYLIAALILLPLIVFSQEWNVNSDYWTATDALGRTTPTADETGPTRDGKFIAMFYWTWHTDGIAEFSPVMNITEIITKHPEAAHDPNHSAWKGIWGGVFWWDEPLFGYYRTTDDWVLRKHAEMLADAGVDAVFFDCTNGAFTWKSSYTKLLQVWEQARKDGVKTPQIAFMLPFSPTEGGLASIKELYRDLYKPGLYRDLWFIWKGKPIIMAYPEMLKAKPGDTAALRFTADSSFLAIDVHCPSWNNNIGNLTLSLYKWNSTYAATVAGQPIASKTFENFGDNAWLRMDFDAQGLGEYLWVLSDPTEVVGVWKNANSQHPATSYFNGSPVSGDYECGIFSTPDSTRHDLIPYVEPHVPVQLGPGSDAELIAEIKDFFTFRPGQPDYVSGRTRPDQWGWLEVYPQHGYVGYQSFEEVTVGVAQNANDATGGRCYAFNAPGTYGRSYTQTNGQDPRPEAYLYGLNFQEQWGRAFQLDPELVFVTGWNEWIAGRFETWGGCGGVPFPNAFPDEYSWDKSRDIEPVKAWGDSGDVYYIQLVNNVRRFKGMKTQALASAEKTINIGAFDGWTDVKPEYLDYKGDVMHRNHKGQGNALVYTNNSGRNDIQLAKVARDAGNIYFYVETVDELTPKTDAKWMRLFIDIDRNKATGWQGYDFVINRSSPGDSALIEKSIDGWNWEKVGAAAYAVQGNKLELQVDRSIFGLAARDDFEFEFKWSDNMQEDGNIMDFYVNGDVAPGERFNFVFTTMPNTGIGRKTKLPGKYSLLQNYPNPFNPSTTIEFTLPAKTGVELAIYDVLGHRIKVLANGQKTAGSHQAMWNGLDDNGNEVGSGIYFYSLRADNGTIENRSMVLLK